MNWGLRKATEIREAEEGKNEFQSKNFFDSCVYYNRLRLHSALAYVAPDVFNSGQVA